MLYTTDIFVGRNWSEHGVSFATDIYYPFRWGWHAELDCSLETWPGEETENKIRALLAFYDQAGSEVLAIDDPLAEAYRMCKAHPAMMAMRPILEKAKEWTSLKTS